MIVLEILFWAARLRLHGDLNGFDVVEAAVWRDAGGVGLERGSTPEQWTVRAGGDTASVTRDENARASAWPTLVKLGVEGAAGPVLEGAAAIVVARRTTFVCELRLVEAVDRRSRPPKVYTVRYNLDAAQLSIDPAAFARAKNIPYHLEYFYA